MEREKTISPGDLKLLLLTDDIDEAIEHINTYVNKNYKTVVARKKWWLFEKV
jgi:hypothetical protein